MFGRKEGPPPPDPFKTGVEAGAISPRMDDVKRGPGAHEVDGQWHRIEMGDGHGRFEMDGQGRVEMDTKGGDLKEDTKGGHLKEDTKGGHLKEDISPQTPQPMVYQGGPPVVFAQTVVVYQQGNS